MAIDFRDYYNIFMDEGEQFYSDIYPLNQNDFNEWIACEFIELNTIQSFNEVIPSIAIIDQLVDNGYKHKGYQCHYSAKAVNLINEEFEFWTGFVSINSFPYSIVTHSFNVKNGNIVDLSRTEDDFQILDQEETGLPHAYYGMNIPTEFVSKFRRETFEEYSMKPLIVEWFKEVNNIL